MRVHPRRLLVTLLITSGLFVACGGGGSPAPPPPAPLQVALSANLLKAPQNGAPATVTVTVTRPSGRSSSVSLSVSGLPAGVSTQVTSPGSGNTGTVTLTAASTAPAGTYALSIVAGDGISSGNAGLTLIVSIVATVGAEVVGEFNTFMSTSFQPASWSDQFFVQNPSATTPLEDLQSQHIRLQALDRDIPQRTPTTWDFSYLDGMVNPVLSVTDHSPEFQIARGPDFMYALQDSNGNLADATYQQFADYAANLVRYYDTGGFVDGSGVLHKSSSPYPILWWGIYNEPNLTPITPAEYTELYNTVVPAMLAVDSRLKFAAVELSDWGDQPQVYLPTFVSQVTAPVDVFATHFYSTCNQLDTDQQLFDSLDAFVPHLTYEREQLQTNPALANVPIWMTENNVNADYDKGGGISACNGGPFVRDLRGSSAFFAAWRSTLFSKFGRAGLRALYHWDFNADAQFGEVDYITVQPYLSYWVDYWLARFFPAPAGSELLALSITESRTVEVLPTRLADGSVLIMVANHAVHSSTDNNGAGDPRTVVIDVSPLGSFSDASLLTIDASTDRLAGPSPVTVTPAPQMEITLGGYGVSFLKLTPAASAP